VNDEPRSRASDEVRGRFVALGRIDDMSADEFEKFRERFADDFVRDDRRRIVTLPSATLEDFIGSIRAYWQIGAGAPTFSVAEVIAVRGDRLVLFRTRVEFSDGSATEFLSLDEYDHQMRTKRIISFDVDDRSAALDELERLHARVG
jgi:hypothetical protein